MGYTGRMIIARFFHSHPEGILRIKIEYPVVFNIDLRDPVIGGG
jgi:hypothetical protein